MATPGRKCENKKREEKKEESTGLGGIGMGSKRLVQRRSPLASSRPKVGSGRTAREERHSDASKSQYISGRTRAGQKRLVSAAPPLCGRKGGLIARQGNAATPSRQIPRKYLEASFCGPPPLRPHITRQLVNRLAGAHTMVMTRDPVKLDVAPSTPELL